MQGKQPNYSDLVEILVKIQNIKKYIAIKNTINWKA